MPGIRDLILAKRMERYIRLVRFEDSLKLYSAIVN